jgi:hypothetical protein
VPEDYVSKEIFDAVSVYIIPKEQLDSCIITVNVLGHKITGYLEKMCTVWNHFDSLFFHQQDIQFAFQMKNIHVTF